MALVRGVHRWPVNSPHKGPVTRKIFQFDDVIVVVPGGTGGCYNDNPLCHTLREDHENSRFSARVDKLEQYCVRERVSSDQPPWRYVTLRRRSTLRELFSLFALRRALSWIDWPTVWFQLYPSGIFHLSGAIGHVTLADIHDDVIKWKHFPRNWPFVRGIHRSRWIPHTKASDAELWCFLWSASE